MRLTIIKEDGTVILNGVTFSGLDMSAMPSGVTAVQWYETYGEVEYSASIIDNHMVKPKNTIIFSISDYQFAIDAHQLEAANMPNPEDVPEAEKATE